MDTKSGKGRENPFTPMPGGRFVGKALDKPQACVRLTGYSMNARANCARTKSEKAHFCQTLRSSPKNGRHSLIHFLRTDLRVAPS